MHRSTVLLTPSLGLWLAMSIIEGPAHAEPPPPETLISVQIENDFFSSSGDRYYTHGTQLSVLKKTAPSAWVGLLSEGVPFYEKGQQLKLVNYTLVQKIFTPNDTEATTVVEGDRPYAGDLYATTYNDL